MGLTYYIDVIKRFFLKKFFNRSLLIIYILLTSCVFSFLSMVIQIVNYELTLLIHLIIIYLIMLYNQPLITKEFNNYRFLTYSVDKSSRARLFFSLVIDSNPVCYLLPVFFIINVLFNFSDPYKILLLIYSCIIIFNLLLIKQHISGYQRFVFLFTLFSIIAISFLNSKILILCFLISAILCYFININLFKFSFSIDREFSSKSPLLSIADSNHFFLFNVVWKQIYVISNNRILWMLASFLTGVVVNHLFANDFASLFIYGAMLEFELQLDEKYKYLYKFQPKFYFLKNGELRFFERFIISYNFLYSVTLLFYMILFAIGSNIHLSKLILYVLLLIILSGIYYRIEERMYIKAKKLNSFTFQYLVFTLLSIVILFVNLL